MLYGTRGAGNDCENRGGDSQQASLNKGGGVKMNDKVERADVQELVVGIFNSRGADDTKTIKFSGQLLAGVECYYGQTSDTKDRGTDWLIFRTKKGRYLIHWHSWSRWDGEGGRSDYAIKNWLPKRGDVLYGVATDEPSPGIPGELIRDAAEAEGLDITEVLDV
jgi:hypothetical protein